MQGAKGDMDFKGGSGVNARYRMPVGFGPSPSPRQRPDGQRWMDPMARIRAVAVSFLATLYPAWNATRIAPAEVLRYE